MKVKFLFTRTPLLQHFNPTLPLRLETDASTFAVEAILSQLYQDRWHLIAFLSRKLQDAKLRY
ncbi:MAG TPA: ribonuclease H family protein, partial [Methylomirabilota bacterium]|nr:ribonuclease H family protein [Methylomirabilota bacterium]